MLTTPCPLSHACHRCALLCQVSRLIEQRRRAGWTFVFLGTNQDAVVSARGLAVPRGAASNFVPDARGLQHVWADLSGCTRRVRSAMRAGQPRTEGQRANYLRGFSSAEQDFELRGSTATPEQQQQWQQLQGRSAKGRGLGHAGKGHGRGGRRRIRQEHAKARAAAAAAVEG